MSGSISALLEGRPDEAAQMRGYLQQAQSKIDGFASRLETAGPQGVFDDLSSFARRRPGAFLLTAGVAGFAIGRLARAGTAAAHDQQSSQSSQSMPSQSSQPAMSLQPPQTALGQPTMAQQGGW
jgi:hypothetical protein